MKFEMLIIALVGFGLFVIGVATGADIVEKQWRQRHETSLQSNCNSKVAT